MRIKSDRIEVLVLQGIVRTYAQTLERVVIVFLNRERDIVIGGITITCGYGDTSLTIQTTRGDADLLELIIRNRFDGRQRRRTDRQFVTIIGNIRRETLERLAVHLNTGQSRDLRLSGREYEFIHRLVRLVTCKYGQTGRSVNTAFILRYRLELIARRIKDRRQLFGTHLEVNIVSRYLGIKSNLGGISLFGRISECNLVSHHLQISEVGIRGLLNLDIQLIGFRRSSTRRSNNDLHRRTVKRIACRERIRRNGDRLLSGRISGYRFYRQRRSTYR